MKISLVSLDPLGTPLAALRQWMGLPPCVGLVLLAPTFPKSLCNHHRVQRVKIGERSGQVQDCFARNPHIKTVILFVTNNVCQILNASLCIVAQICLRVVIIDSDGLHDIFTGMLVGHKHLDGLTLSMTESYDGCTLQEERRPHVPSESDTPSVATSCWCF